MGTIYLIADHEGYLKIGFTGKAIAERMRELQNGNPRELTLIATIPGSLRDEKGLHERFAAKRYRGEWYYYNAAITGAFDEGKSKGQ